MSLTSFVAMPAAKALKRAEEPAEAGPYEDLLRSHRVKRKTPHFSGSVKKPQRRAWSCT